MSWTGVGQEWQGVARSGKEWQRVGVFCDVFVVVCVCVVEGEDRV